MGDDFTDVVVMHRVGFAVAVANAKPEVKAHAHWVTANPGGHGALRDVVELLLKAQGRWDDILRHYELAGEGRSADTRDHEAGGLIRDAWGTSRSGASAPSRLTKVRGSNPLSNSHLLGRWPQCIFYILS